jgi:hypothetical protein
VAARLKAAGVRRGVAVVNKRRPALKNKPARAGWQVTLIDQSERFVFKPLLYELVNGAASPEEVAPPFVQLLSPYSVNFVQVLALACVRTTVSAALLCLPCGTPTAARRQRLSPCSAPLVGRLLHFALWVKQIGKANG